MRRFAVRKKDKKEYFDRGSRDWSRDLRESHLHRTRTDADRTTEDASRHGDDPSKPLPVKVVPVETTEIDE
ncbi:MAG: hypothetical protein ACXABY_19995 [Candidatus Thorarchaeota archaeon]|jgi:hypothetical protein